MIELIQETVDRDKLNSDKEKDRVSMHQYETPQKLNKK
jgi:hypothetical protein